VANEHAPALRVDLIREHFAKLIQSDRAHLIYGVLNFQRFNCSAVTSEQMSEATRA
jgi:hypothetical protein